MALMTSLYGQLEANSCCFDIKVGAEYLYWDPCGADLDYAVIAEDNSTIRLASELRTKHLEHDADSGYRIYGKAENVWQNFDVGLIYTKFSTHAHKFHESDVAKSIALGISLPNNNPDQLVGDSVSSNWHFDYQVVDAIVSHPLNLSCDPCWHFESFGGLKWLRMKQRKTTILTSSLSQTSLENGQSSFHQHVHASGVGPTFGMHSSYMICDSLKMFGMAAGSVIIGDSKNHDHYRETAPDVVFFDQEYKNHHDCVCFSGIHLKTGLAYNTCWCNMQMGFHIGWEYIQWINAPGFTYYENNDNGAKSAPSEKNFALQGLFVGADISF